MFLDLKIKVRNRNNENVPLEKFFSNLNKEYPCQKYYITLSRKKNKDILFSWLYLFIYTFENNTLTYVSIFFSLMGCKPFASFNFSSIIAN